jgi:hypothetical protein
MPGEQLGESVYIPIIKCDKCGYEGKAAANGSNKGKPQYRCPKCKKYVKDPKANEAKLKQRPKQRLEQRNKVLTKLKSNVYNISKTKKILKEQGISNYIFDKIIQEERKIDENLDRLINNFNPVSASAEVRFCSKCGGKMKVHTTYKRLAKEEKAANKANKSSSIKKLEKIKRYQCSQCGRTESETRKPLPSASDVFYSYAKYWPLLSRAAKKLNISRHKAKNILETETGFTLWELNHQINKILSYIDDKKCLSKAELIDPEFMRKLLYEFLCGLKDKSWESQILVDYHSHVVLGSVYDKSKNKVVRIPY